MQWSDCSINLAAQRFLSTALLRNKLASKVVFRLHIARRIRSPVKTIIGKFHYRRERLVLPNTLTLLEQLSHSSKKDSRTKPGYPPRFIIHEQLFVLQLLNQS